MIIIGGRLTMNNDINIFLGSSIVELQEERDAFSDIVNELNVKLQNTGNFIYLDRCEYENGFFAGKPTQQIIDRKILNSSYSYFIVKTKFGKWTEHEFDVALENFLEFGTPKLCVMFRKCLEGESLSEEALLFQNRLKQLQYYYKEYENKEELKLNVVLNLVVDDILLDKEISVEDSGIYIGNIRLINTELIPVYSKHSELTKLHEYLDELESQERNCENKRERRLLREKIRKVVTEVRKIEKLIYQTMLGLTRATRGKITPLLNRAIVYIENGDIEKAAEILNVDDVIDELEEYKDKTELSMTGIQSAIETTYIAIETILQLPESLERSKKIEFLFEKIISIELYYNLNRLHCGLYVRYLIDKQKYNKAEKYILIYTEAVDIRINSIDDFLRSEYALLGMQLSIEKIYRKDRERYQYLYIRTAYSYILIYAKAVEKFPNNININPYMLGILCDNLMEDLKDWIGEKNDTIKNIEKQLIARIELLKKIGYRKVNSSELNGKEDARRLIAQIELKKECDKLNDEPQTDEPKEYLKQYAKMIESLVNFFQHSDNMFVQNNSSIQLIRQEYEKINLALKENHDETLLFLYSQIKINYAEHYMKVANFDIAEKDYRVAYDKLRMLSQCGEQIYKFFLCAVSFGLSITLSYLDKHSEAENILIEGIDTCEKLARHENQYYRLLAEMYTNYVVLCVNGRIYDRITKGVEYSKKAYDVFKKHIKMLYDGDKIIYINLSYHYGLLLLENGKFKDAFYGLFEGIDIVNSLNESCIQENYDLINKFISLSIEVSLKIGEIDELKKKIESLYSVEAIELMISQLERNTNL